MEQKVFFQELFDANYEKLCHVAHRIVKDPDDARDLVQQVFLDFWEKKSQWAEILSPGAYLYTSVYHSSLRHSKKSRLLITEDQDTPNSDLVDSPLDVLAFSELEQRVMRSISDLPPKCREIFLLSREEEMSYKQIAESLGISIKTVEAQMGIALKRLREDLTKDAPGKIFFLLFF